MNKHSHIQHSDCDCQCRYRYPSGTFSHWPNALRPIKDRMQY